MKITEFQARQIEIDKMCDNGLISDKEHVLLNEQLNKKYQDEAQTELDRRVDRIKRRVEKFDAVRRLNAVEMYYTPDNKIAFRGAK